jgi:hypothetical protein
MIVSSEKILDDQIDKFFSFRFSDLLLGKESNLEDKFRILNDSIKSDKAIANDILLQELRLVKVLDESKIKSCSIALFLVRMKMSGRITLDSFVRLRKQH